MPFTTNRNDSYITARGMNSANPDAPAGYRKDGTFDDTPTYGQLYDRTAFDYGGNAVGFGAEERRLQGQVDAARSRQTPQVDNALALALMQRTQASRGQQAEAAGMFQQAGMGQGPTVAPAQMSLANALATGQGAQMLAQGPRGPAGAAATRAAALQGTGQMMGQNALGAALARSGEQFGGMQGYQGTTNAIYGGDMSGAKIQAGLANNAADIRASGQAANDARELGYAGIRQGALGQQSMGKIAREEFQRDDLRWKTALDQGIARYNATTAQQNYENGMSMAAAGTGVLGQYLVTKEQKKTDDGGGKVGVDSSGRYQW